MKTTSISLFMIILASALFVPVSFSQAETDNATSANQSSASMLFNQTETNETNVGQQISDFVHQAVAHFKQQREDTINAIKDCRQKIQNASATDREKVREDCKTMMKGIREKYQDERNHFQEVFQEYRESVITMTKEAQGTHVEKLEMDKAIQHIQEMERKKMNMTKNDEYEKGMNMTNDEQYKNDSEDHAGKGLRTKDNPNCVNPPNGPKIC